MPVWLGMGMMSGSVVAIIAALWSGEWRFLILPLAVYLLLRYGDE